VPARGTAETGGFIEVASGTKTGIVGEEGRMIDDDSLPSATWGGGVPPETDVSVSVDSEVASR